MHLFILNTLIYIAILQMWQEVLLRFRYFLL